MTVTINPSLALGVYKIRVTAYLNDGSSLVPRFEYKEHTFEIVP